MRIALQFEASPAETWANLVKDALQGEKRNLGKLDDVNFLTEIANRTKSLSTLSSYRVDDVARRSSFEECEIPDAQHLFTVIPAIGNLMYATLKGEERFKDLASKCDKIDIALVLEELEARQKAIDEKKVILEHEWKVGAGAVVRSDEPATKRARISTRLDALHDSKLMFKDQIETYLIGRYKRVATMTKEALVALNSDIHDAAGQKFDSGAAGAWHLAVLSALDEDADVDIASWQAVRMQVQSMKKLFTTVQATDKLCEAIDQNPLKIFGWKSMALMKVSDEAGILLGARRVIGGCALTQAASKKLKGQSREDEFFAAKKFFLDRGIIVGSSFERWLAKASAAASAVQAP